MICNTEWHSADLFKANDFGMTLRVSYLCQDKRTSLYHEILPIFYEHIIVLYSNNTFSVGNPGVYDHFLANGSIPEAVDSEQNSVTL